MLKADYDFLARQRAQRAQAQFPSDISETSSQPQLEENEEEIEEIEELQTNDVSQPEIQKNDVCETKLNTSPIQGEVEIQVEVEIKKIQKTSSPISDVVAPQQKQEQALELLKSAFEQIKLALSLLDDKKFHQEIEEFSRALSPVAEEPSVEMTEEPVVQVVEEPVVQVAEEPLVIKNEETFASKAKKSFSPNVAETFSSKTKKSIVQMTDESIVKKMKDEDEEFQVVMPKKSKKNSATIIVAPITAIVVEKKDDFPSLGSSFSPVQKTGFWNSGKNSLEIAKSIAQIPSPPPTRSPTLVKTIKARAGSRGPIDEDDDFCDDEYKHRKNGNDDDYWQ